MHHLTSCILALLMLLASVPALHAQEEIYAASIVAGNCGDIVATVAELSIGQLPGGAEAGSATARPAAYSFTTVDVPFDALVATEHAITSGEVCGQIGGPLNSAGALVIVLAGPEGDSGIAYVNPNGADPARSDVSLFLAADAAGLQAAPGEPDVGEPTPPAADDEGSATIAPSTVTPTPTRPPARAEPAVARSITIYVVRCPLALVGDGSGDACEGSPIGGTAFRITQPLTDASTPLVATNENGLVSFRLDAFPPGDTLRVVQELPAGTEDFVAFCLDEDGTKLRITYPALPGLDPSLGVTDIGVREAQEVFCDWFNVPAAPPEAPTRVPAPPTPTPIPPPPAPACDLSYSTLCLPYPPDLDCIDIDANGFPVSPPDPHGLDGDFDGLGCEVDAGPPVEPSVVPPSNCDPSYPTLCLPSFPDLDCGEIGDRRFPVLPPDPHGFDGDFDGVGCESG